VVFSAGPERAGNDPAWVRADIFQGLIGDAFEQARNNDRIREDGFAQLLMGDQNLGFRKNGRFFIKTSLRFSCHSMVILIFIRPKSNEPHCLSKKLLKTGLEFYLLWVSRANRNHTKKSGVDILKFQTSPVFPYCLTSSTRRFLARASMAAGLGYTIDHKKINCKVQDCKIKQKNLQ
jgi:hypothetical protein